MSTAKKTKKATPRGVADEDRQLDEHNARRRALGHIALYKRERNGLLIWRAYREFRSEGMLVPKYILEAFDQWAAQLENASGASAVAAAIEMGGPIRGPRSAAHLRKVEQQRSVVADVVFYENLGMSLEQAQRRVAVDMVDAQWLAEEPEALVVLEDERAKKLLEARKEKFCTPLRPKALKKVKDAWRRWLAPSKHRPTDDTEADADRIMRTLGSK